ncbi:soul heme-binding protein, putative [Ichthyophthirius multifiliis]|uniref:Soul heme-binding protein, putative n=1 Tax=Ichthyophthirius multifiliis TaxID=5932 RepID=G0QL77_ICHMU|nr:soul heme-binding protein, putative [Ichthyophthirius multifiliis]EGR34028.1 soul heme-binding protein, putative [Ichthyophthirius multifiliis]|eukprot:XP_004039332.1 soul heme-binding protein, putative [Ichthyophthirius multifiliis]
MNKQLFTLLTGAIAITLLYHFNVFQMIGQIFGFNGVKEPQYSLIQKTPYQIRKYESYVIAKIAMKEDNKDQAFRALARYIGVFGKPENTQNQSLVMTVPVLQEPVKMEMTAPVIFENGYMSFVLPEKYKQVEQSPQPLNKEISLEKVDEKNIAVLQFSGYGKNEDFNQKLEELIQLMKKDKHIKENAKQEDLNVQFARYNPPFCIPMFRRNEVWINMEK